MTTKTIRDSLSPALLASLAEGVAQGEYSLLLGAGASVGATSGGRTIPMASQLAQEIVTDFRIPADPNAISLQDAYEAALSRLTDSGHSLQDYIKARFLSCTPPAWCNRLPEFSWRRIWSLNIDDCVARAYSQHASPRQVASAINWFEPHNDVELDELQVVLLHGSAKHPDRLVFSVAEYLNAASSSHSWHRIFADHYQQRPFIVVGATLRGEFDLAAVIRRGSQSLRLHGRPSILVSPHFEPLQREFLEKYGLIPVELTAESFIEQLTAPVRGAERTLKSTIAVRGAVIPAEAQTFLSSFQRLPNDAVPPRKPRDFYLGYDPTWFDILLEKDAAFDVVRSVSESLKALREKGRPSQRLEIIHGSWGTGKSTSLLRIGRELMLSGQEVYLFRGEETVDPESTAWWLSRQPNAVLLFDGVADFTSELETLLESCEQAGVRAHMVGVDRHQRMRRIESSVSAKFLRYDGTRHLRVLSNTDIQALLKTLELHSRLGRITRWRSDERFAYFARDHRRQLFSAMSELEGGPGFLERFTREMQAKVLSQGERQVLYMCAFAYEFGYPLPVGIATNASGLSSSALVESVENGALSEWLDLVALGLRLRNRRFAQHIVETVLDRSTRFTITQELAGSLAPRVDRDAIYRRTIEYRIARNILDSENVGRWVGSDTAIQWYAQLEVGYGWNARYWEQRALTHLRQRDIATARSYAEKAVSIHPDPFTQTTLAHVMLRQVETRLAESGEFRLGDYLEAAEVLRRARDGSRHRDDYPYTVFFDASLRLLRRLKTSRISAKEVEDEVGQWIDDAEESRLAQHSDYVRLIARVRREFATVAR